MALEPLVCRIESHFVKSTASCVAGRTLARRSGRRRSARRRLRRGARGDRHEEPLPCAIPRRPTERHRMNASCGARSGARSGREADFCRFYDRHPRWHDAESGPAALERLSHGPADDHAAGAVEGRGGPSRPLRGSARRSRTARGPRRRLGGGIVVEAPPGRSGPWVARTRPRGAREPGGSRAQCARAMPGTRDEAALRRQMPCAAASSAPRTRSTAAACAAGRIAPHLRRPPRGRLTEYNEPLPRK